jgi:hypothetical protein
LKWHPDRNKDNQEVASKKFKQVSGRESHASFREGGVGVVWW